MADIVVFGPNWQRWCSHVHKVRRCRWTRLRPRIAHAAQEFRREFAVVQSSVHGRAFDATATESVRILFFRIGSFDYKSDQRRLGIRTQLSHTAFAITGGALACALIFIRFRRALLKCINNGLL